MDWQGGAMSGAVYDGSQELGSLMSKVRIKTDTFSETFSALVARHSTYSLLDPTRPNHCNLYSYDTENRTVKPSQ